MSVRRGEQSVVNALWERGGGRCAVGYAFIMGITEVLPPNGRPTSCQIRRRQKSIEQLLNTPWYLDATEMMI